MFTLDVSDGYLDSEIKDSVYVKAMSLPAPAKVFIDTSYFFEKIIFGERELYTDLKLIHNNFIDFLANRNPIRRRKIPNESGSR